MIALPIGRPIGAAGCMLTQQNIDINHMHGHAPRRLPQIANRQIFSRRHRHCMAAPPLPRNRARLSTAARAGGSEGSGAPGSDASYTSEDIASQLSTTTAGSLSPDDILHPNEPPYLQIRKSLQKQIGKSPNSFYCMLTTTPAMNG